MLPPSLLSGCTNPELFEAMYKRYMEDPLSVDLSWRQLFDGFERDSLSCSPSKAASTADHGPTASAANVLESYRRYGHLLAKTNPILRSPLEEPEELGLHQLGFTSEDLDKEFPIESPCWPASAKLSEIIAKLRKIYCGSMGIEVMDIQNPALLHWLQEKLEGESSPLDGDHKKRILQFLNQSELFEAFIHTKYPGQKRFSLEGAETLIPMLDLLIQEGSRLGISQIVLGMSHRGRLNVLSNILAKSYQDIFSEFDPHYLPETKGEGGDVKYHKGFSADKVTLEGKKLHIELIPNPSHLESVDPVVEGYARAIQEKLAHADAYKEVIPVLIHGDAALAGQGVVYETLQMSQLEGYATGGTLHIIVNNQIGFTTIPEDGRSTRYCSDIAKTFGAPVFHVNAEDPEESLRAFYLALHIRQKFACDVFIDLVCYRKYGHNESDEPAFTQPLEYKVIRSKRPIREIYRDRLIEEGILDQVVAEKLETEFKDSLQKALQGSRELTENNHNNYNFSEKTPENSEDIFAVAQTAVQPEQLRRLAKGFCSLPSDFQPHPKLKELFAARLKMVEGDPQEKLIDWGMGEMLAYASLLDEGRHIRLSGQDCGRGTFSHRHALLVDQNEEKNFVPLNFISNHQASFDIYNSPLSEYGVLGFEYGYSMEYDEALVLWEAQFGDFCNGAQIIIDQYISSSEQKWGKRSRLVLLLPHGYEGQGPEHSSARIERFLSLAGSDNMQIVNPTTPAQLFHLLRRQLIRKLKKPLIVFTPKALLRHPSCLSSIEDFSEGFFNEIIDVPQNEAKAKRLAFCSGKIYYELEALRTQKNDKELALIRIEQLYPLPVEKLKVLIKKYSVAEKFLWVQEEPSNMGAWNYISPQLQALLPTNQHLVYAGRERSASPATGIHLFHQQQHQAIVDKVFENTTR